LSCLELAALPSTPHRARQHTQAALNAWQLPAETVRTAQLIVSELVTNSIQAISADPASRGEPNPDDAARIELTLRLLPGRIVIEVSDTHPGAPVPADADPEAEAGRGLMLVQALSKEWGYFCPPSRGGKTVYAVVCAPDDATPEHSQHTPVTQDTDMTTTPAAHADSGGRPHRQKGTPMSAPPCSTGNEPAGTGTVVSALLTIADELTASGFGAHSPIWDGSAYLKITSAHGALCDLTITTDSTVTWDYRSHHGSHINPGQITGIVPDLLSPGTGRPPAAVPARDADITLKPGFGHRWLIQTEPSLRAWPAGHRPPDGRHSRLPARRTAWELAGKPAAAEVAEP